MSKPPKQTRRTEQGVLDNPVWTALTGPHAHLTEINGQVARYPVDVSPFVAFRHQATDQDWDDLATLAGPGAVVALSGVDLAPPPDWAVLWEGGRCAAGGHVRGARP
jgi:hypothetical protein